MKCREWKNLTQCAKPDGVYTHVVRGGRDLHVANAYKPVFVVVSCICVGVLCKILFDRVGRKWIVGSSVLFVCYSCWYLMMPDASPALYAVGGLCVLFLCLCADRNRRHDLLPSRASKVWGGIAIVMTLGGSMMFAVLFGKIDRSINPGLILVIGGFISGNCAWALLWVLSREALDHVSMDLKMALVTFQDYVMLSVQRDFIMELTDNRVVVTASVAMAVAEVLSHTLFTFLKVREHLQVKVKGGERDAMHSWTHPRLDAIDILTDIAAEHVTMVIATCKVLVLDPVFFRVGSPLTSRPAASILESFGIQFGTEIMADVACVIASVLLWRRGGMHFPLHAVDVNNTMLAFMLAVALGGLLNVGYLLRDECFACDLRDDSFACFDCDG